MPHSKPTFTGARIYLAILQYYFPEDLNVQLRVHLLRTPGYLIQSLKDAETGNYSLGIKLVRGAYHPHEVAAHPSATPSHSLSSNSAPYSLSISSETLPPVWLTKFETDLCYNSMVKFLVSVIKNDLDNKQRGGALGVGVLFGSHNWESCDLILEELARQGLANREVGEGGKEFIRVGVEVGERVTIGQLFGMSLLFPPVAYCIKVWFIGMNDALGNSIVGKTRSLYPFLIKYIPYGALSEVYPRQFTVYLAFFPKIPLLSGHALPEPQGYRK